MGDQCDAERGVSLAEKKNMLLSSETRFGIEVTGELHLYVQSCNNNVMYNQNYTYVPVSFTVRLFIEIVKIAFTIPNV